MKIKILILSEKDSRNYRLIKFMYFTDIGILIANENVGIFTKKNVMILKNQHELKTKYTAFSF